MSETLYVERVQMNKSASVEKRPQIMSPYIRIRAAGLLLARIQAAGIPIHQHGLEEISNNEALGHLDDTMRVTVDQNVQGTIMLRCDTWDFIASLVAMGWRGSAALLDQCRNIPMLYKMAHEEAVTEWVLTNGIRFPAKEGQKISFKTTSGFNVTADCLGVFRPTAQGLAAWDGSGAVGGVYRLNAEDVTSVVQGNVSRVAQISRLPANPFLAEAQQSVE